MMEREANQPEGMVSLRNYVQGVVSFEEKELADILSHFQPMHLPAGEYFVDEGTVCEHIGFITKGYMRSYYEINEVEVTKTVLPRHHIVTAHASFSMKRPSMEYIQAISDTDLLVIDHASMYSLYDKYHRWERLGRLIMEQVYGHTEGRVVAFLTLSAEDRYRKLLEDDPHIFKKVPLRYIASMIGITPETLSRIRNKVHKAKAD
jgi:CRP-like cAMP-binding protein